MASRLRANRWFIVGGGCAVAIGLVALIAWTPPSHDVRTPGAVPIANVKVAPSDGVGMPVYFSATTPAPSTSLDDERCQAWLSRAKGPCPDAATLAQQLWPSLAQNPKTLYVTVPASCGGFNVEYMASSHTLVVHCYTALGWYVAPDLGPPGVEAAPTLILLLVPTGSIAPGDLTVVRDDRVEHLVGDDSSQVVLGKVAIS